MLPHWLGKRIKDVETFPSQTGNGEAHKGKPKNLEGKPKENSIWMNTGFAV